MYIMLSLIALKTIEIGYRVLRASLVADLVPAQPDAWSQVFLLALNAAQTVALAWIAAKYNKDRNAAKRRRKAPRGTRKGRRLTKLD